VWNPTSNQQKRRCQLKEVKGVWPNTWFFVGRNPVDIFTVSSDEVYPPGTLSTDITESKSTPSRIKMDKKVPKKKYDRGPYAAYTSMALVQSQ